MQIVTVDWLRSDKREENLATRPGNIVQKFAADVRPKFFLVVNFQVLGSTTYIVASYYMTLNVTVLLDFVPASSLVVSVVVVLGGFARTVYESPIQLPPIGHNARVEDIVVSGTAIARIFLAIFTRSEKLFCQWELL
nr:protein enhanced disease resistance 2-like [Tanacetum cinerariifolium]